MKKYTLTRIYRTTVDKNHNPLRTKNGQPYERVSIQTVEHPNAWISGFGSSETNNWKEGDTVGLEVTKNGEYYNWKLPNKEDEISLKLNKIDETTSEILKMMKNPAASLVASTPDVPVEDDEDLKIPF